MHDIIEHYGKVVVALFAIIAALAIAALVVTTVSTKTNEAAGQLEYNDDANKSVISGAKSNAIAEITAIPDSEFKSGTPSKQTYIEAINACPDDDDVSLTRINTIVNAAKSHSAVPTY